MFNSNLCWESLLEAELKDRFYSKIEFIPFHECWEWTAGLDKDGYGKFWFKNETIRAHRFSYELHFGPIKEGLCVCHTCDNPGCVRPEHLWLGTIQENSKDRDNKKRGGQSKKTHCKNGHIFDEKNTYYIKNVGRHCRSCRKIVWTKWYKRNKSN